MREQVKTCGENHTILRKNNEHLLPPVTVKSSQHISESNIYFQYKRYTQLDHNKIILFVIFYHTHTENRLHFSFFVINNDHNHRNILLVCLVLPICVQQH